MARRTTVAVFDDFDGTTGARAVRFGLDGTWYSVDLTPEHEAELREIMAKYVDAAVTHKAKKYPEKNDTGYNAQDVRRWLADQNIAISARGRIPRVYLDQYAARNQ